MKHLYNYYEYKFTSESRRKLSSANIEFWQKLADIEKRHSVQLIITHDLKQDIHPVLEELKFECANPDILPEAEAVYRNYYQHLPLKPVEQAKGVR